MIRSVPDDTPLTTPVDEPIVATLGEPEVHVPPPVALNKEVVPPTHTVITPVIAPGGGSTVTVNVAEHPELIV